MSTRLGKKKRHAPIKKANNRADLNRSEINCLDNAQGSFYVDIMFFY